jgi:Bcr/CflA subfamily drug resistance transporter
MKNKTTSSLVLLLAPFIFTFAVALDIYVPSIPAIRAYFHTSPDVVQLTVSCFILMTGIGQLIMGPLSDHFGRRVVIVGGTIIFFLGSVLATVSPTIWLLIVARIIQGIGACSMMVATFALVRDLYSGEEVARIYSFLNSTISLSPLLAPVIGGYLAEWYGWRAAFAFLVVMSFLMILFSLFKIKETHATENRVKFSKNIWNNYAQIIRNRKFQMYTFCASAGFACFLTFFSVSSYIIIVLLKIPEQHFGFYFATIGVVFFFSSLLSGHSAKAIGTYATVLLGALLIVISGLLMLLWYKLFGLSIYGFMGPMVVMSLGGAFVMGGGAGGAIEPFPEIAGVASALFGSCEFVFAFVVSTFVLQWKVLSTEPLSYTLIALGGLSMLFCASLYRRCHAKVK